MQRKFPILALLVFPLAVLGCENKLDTTTTTTTAPPAATPAAPAAPAATGPTRVVAFELEGAVPVGALQIDVTYAGEGRFVGDADAVACQTKVDGALSSYNHIVAEKKLRAAFVAVKGFAGPTRFSECQFQGDPKAGNFTVTVRDSSSPELEEITPPPGVKVVID